MHKKLPYEIADRLTDEWSPAMRMTAQDFAKKLRAAKTDKEWREIVERFQRWVIEHRYIQF